MNELRLASQPKLTISQKWTPISTILGFARSGGRYLPMPSSVSPPAFTNSARARDADVHFLHNGIEAVTRAQRIEPLVACECYVRVETSIHDVSEDLDRAIEVAG